MSFNKALVFAVMIIGVVAFFKSKMNINNSEERISIHPEDRIDDRKEEVQSYTIHRSDFNLASISTIKRSRTPEKILIETTNGSEIPVSVKNIKYCESYNGDVIIYRDNKDDVITNMTLKNLKNKISQPSFIYEKLQSYIINFDYIEKLSRNRVEGSNNYKPYIMSTGDSNKIYIPKAKYQDFRKEYQEYLNSNTIN